MLSSFERRPPMAFPPRNPGDRAGTRAFVYAARVNPPCEGRLANDALGRWSGCDAASRKWGGEAPFDLGLTVEAGAAYEKAVGASGATLVILRYRTTTLPVDCLRPPRQRVSRENRRRPCADNLAAGPRSPLTHRRPSGTSAQKNGLERRAGVDPTRPLSRLPASAILCARVSLSVPHNL